jgi:hypothetical protein
MAGREDGKTVFLLLNVSSFTITCYTVQLIYFLSFFPLIDIAFPVAPRLLSEFGAQSESGTSLSQLGARKS